jgi:hypothetical protein
MLKGMNLKGKHAVGTIQGSCRFRVVLLRITDKGSNIGYGCDPELTSNLS